MSDFARVDSIEALQAFRASLCKFADAARVALDEADAEFSRAVQWLDEQHPHWRGRVDRYREQTNRANLELMNKQYTKQLLDSAMSVVEERKALAAMKRKLEHAETTLTAIARWQRELEREGLVYRSGVQRLANTIDQDIPVALTLLDNMVRAIEEYLQAGSGEAQRELDDRSNTEGE